jgi:predicted phage baseplate assembly protein
MPLPDLQLDDRTFETLVADAKRLIPGYTPEWTDLNDSDPGITLVQLFAWLGEMIIYRLNKVPDKNYIEFLKLIGIELTPPAPAKGELTFHLSAPSLTSPPGSPPETEALVVPVAKGTEVATTQPDADGAIIFETDIPLNVVGATLQALQSFDGALFALVDQSNAINGQFFYPFGPKPQPQAAFYLGFDRSFPPNKGSYILTVHAHTAGLIEEGQGLSANPVTSVPPVVAIWEYYSATGWQPLNPSSDTTACLTGNGTVTFAGPFNPAATQLGLLRNPTDPSLFWLRYRIDSIPSTGYEVPPRLEDVLINTVTATNVVTVTDEILGASDGGPNQAFLLQNKPVLRDGFVLQVDENDGDGYQPWKMVDNFAGRTRTDKVFTVNVATGEIDFGDGEQGKIPARFADPSRPDQDFANIKVASYQWGGGARGRVGAKTVTALQSPIPYVDSVTNLRPTAGGYDEETLGSAKSRAPQAIRTQSRAVTADDFVFLATQTPGVRIRRAQALPFRNPNIEGIRPAGSGLPLTVTPSPGALSVMVVPDADPANPNPKPIPSSETLSLVANWLDSHRLVTTELYVIAPTYRQVEVDAHVIAKTTANTDQVAQTVEDNLLRYFNPLTGGKDGTGWEFGGTIYFSDVYRLILDTDGVARLEAGAVTIYVDGTRIDSSSDVPLDQDQLVYSGTHKITASYS